jgi:hypothetical protein
VVYALVDVSAPPASEPMAAAVVVYRTASSVELGPIASRGAAVELSRRLLDEVGSALLRSDAVRIVATAHSPSADLLYRLGFHAAVDPDWLVRNL